MKEDTFDCVIVGARCAGAPLATHLSRAGMKICLLDQDDIPSGQPFSTHGISPAGMDYLEELGVGVHVRRSCPPVHVSRIQVGSASAELALTEGREMYCPRRSTLDPLLAEAAAAAGADLRDQTAVLGVIRDDRDPARVVGVLARHAGKTHEIRARYVVGADGRHSTIAKLVRAEEYHVTHAPRGGYWAYYPVTPAFAALPFQVYIEICGNASRFAFRTDGDLVVAGALDTIPTARTWTQDIQAHVHASLAKSEVIGPLLVQGNPPASKFTGLLAGKFFFRAPVGPGWALVGDAGLHKDPTPGYGITDALRDAKALSRALLTGQPAALQVYWRRRDVESVPLYANATAMGSLDYDNPFNRIVIGKLGSEAFAEPLRATMEREVSPFEVIPAWRVLGWAASALLRGKSEILPHLARSVRRGTWVTREMKYRQRLLAEAERSLA